MYPRLSASRPVVGVPSGPVKSMVSSYVTCRLGGEGLATVAFGADVTFPASSPP